MISSPTAVVRYQYDNHLGSASLELDQNAEIISYEEYHPFGTTSYRSGRTETETSLKRYKYVGKEREVEAGLYYCGLLEQFKLITISESAYDKRVYIYE